MSAAAHAVEVDAGVMAPALADGASLAAARAAVRALVARMAEPRRVVEQTFLQMGERLCECAKLLGDIAAAHEGMPAELAGETYTAAARQLEDIRAQVDAMAAAYYSEQEHLKELSERSASVGGPIAQLAEAVREIDLIATNARIVAASFGGSNSNEVVVFTSGMAELARSVNDAVGAFSRSYRALVASLAAARSASEAFAQRHGGTMSGISGKLGSQLATLDGQRSAAAAKVAENGKLTAHIRGGIGSAVSSMQIGDITRQRIEHVEQAFESVDAADSTVGTFYGVCRLQSAQLLEAVRDFDAEVSDLAASLDGLALDADAAVRDSSREAERLLSAGSTALAAMIADLRQTQALLLEYEQTRAGLERIVDQVARSVTAMVDHIGSVRAIEQKIRLLSFNTTIQCGRLGDHGQGRALRVISEQLREVSGKTVFAAGAIMTGLNDFEARTRSIVQGRSSLVAEKMAALGQSAATAIGLFETVEQRLRGRAETMLRIGPEAVRLLKDTAQSVSGRREFSGAWSAAQQEIEALDADAPQPADFAAVDGELLATLRGRYTMEQERQVHDALFGAPLAASAPPLAPVESDSSVDDLLF